MDIFLSVLAIVLLLVGIAGAILPVIPGPIISYAGLASLYFSSHQPFTDRFMLICCATFY